MNSIELQQIKKEFDEELKLQSICEKKMQQTFYQKICLIPKGLQSQIISFLDFNTLEMIRQNCGISQATQNFLTLVRIQYYMMKYLNKTDRTLYYCFYDDKNFKKMECYHITALTDDILKKFFDCEQSHHKLINQIKQLYPQNQQLLSQLQKTITDPWLPLPKLKKQNMGMFCNSSFQNFLIDLKFGTGYQEPYQKCLIMLQDQLKQKQTEHFKLMLELLNKNKQNDIKVRRLRLTPFVINSKSYQQSFLANHTLHNFLVCLFALTQNLVEANRLYIQTIKNPYYQFIEFNLRYHIFKNFILEMQQKYSFAFDMYGQIYDQLINDTLKKPKFSFWRPAMTKWVQEMNHFHTTNMKIYLYNLTKLRTIQFANFVEAESLKYPEQYFPIKNKIQMKQFQLEMGQEIIYHFQEQQIQEYMHLDIYQNLQIDYIQYIIDMSINEHTVHWCGHSEQSLQHPYKQYQTQLLNYNQNYYEYLSKFLAEVATEHAIKQLFNHEIQFFNQKFIKPVSLLKILQQANQSIQKYAKFAKFQTQNQYLITFDFDKNDAMLRYFNEKQQILKQIQENIKCRYSITPLCPAQKILASSIDTRDTDHQNAQQNNSIQNLGDYFSEDSESIAIKEQKEEEEECKNQSQLLKKQSQLSNELKHSFTSKKIRSISSSTSKKYNKKKQKITKGGGVMAKQPDLLELSKNQVSSFCQKSIEQKQHKLQKASSSIDSEIKYDFNF